MCGLTAFFITFIPVSVVLFQKTQDMLRNAWDAEGSPFKGTAFDPSKFTMDPSGMINMKPS